MDTPLLHHARLACLDLTSLNDGAEAATIAALCARAQGPAGPPTALCVRPRFVAQAMAALPAGIRVAAVANFPAGGIALVRQILGAPALRPARLRFGASGLLGDIDAVLGMLGGQHGRPGSGSPSAAGNY